MKVNYRHGTISAMLRIRGLSRSLRERIVEAFTFENPAYAQAARFSPWGPPKGINSHVQLAYEEGDSLYVPRGIDPEGILSKQKHLDEFNSINWKYLVSRCPTTFPEKSLTLNSEQKEIHHKLVYAVEKGKRPFGNFCFISPTSTGKTIAMSVCSSYLGQRTLVLCLTDLIMRAWQNDLKKLFNFKDSDLGIIRQQKWIIGPHFTLASVQTLARRKHRWHELIGKIGTVVLDEVDCVAAPSLYDFLVTFPARYMLGASATMKSSNFYLQSCFGHPVHRVAAKSGDTAHSLHISDAHVIRTEFDYEYEAMELDYHDLVDHMVVSEKRNQVIVKNVYSDYCRDRCVLLVVKRVAHALLLHEMLRELGIIDARILKGGDDRKYRDTLIKNVMSGKTTCVVATSEAIKRGANINRFDSLHVAIPVSKSDMEQLAGRIRRKHENKKDAFITYYLDPRVHYLHRWYKKEIVSAFRKLKIKRFEDMYIA